MSAIPVPRRLGRGPAARFCALCFAVTAAVPPNALTRPLGTPDLVCQTVFGRIGGVRALSRGGMLVLDAERGALAKLDFSSAGWCTGGVLPYSRLRLSSPVKLLATGGDSTLVVNGGAKQWIELGPTGNVARVITSLALPRGRRMGAFRAQAIDRSGRLYFENAGGIRKVDERTFTPDSTLLDRFDPVTGTITTVGRLAPSSALKVVRVGKAMTLYAEAQRFEIADAWAVRGNGEVIIVRVSDYHVDIRSTDGTQRAGPSLGRRATTPSTDPNHGGLHQPSSRNDPTTRIRPRDDVTEARPRHPLFVANSAMLDPRGRLWVMRTEETATVERVYDVLGIGGQLVERVEMPRGTRLVGFGNNALFAARATGARREVLERYRM